MTSERVVLSALVWIWSGLTVAPVSVYCVDSVTGSFSVGWKCFS